MPLRAERGIDIMINRIDLRFEQLRKAGKKAFVAFITAGDPDLKTSEELVSAFEGSGVDIVELGVPFSDPLADGPTIQAASYRALKNGTTLEKIFKLVTRIRKRSAVPLALMTYYNPVFHFGEEAFTAACRDTGVDGVIIPDLPPEEAGTLIPAARRDGVATVFFVAPTTRPQRLPLIIRSSTGFIYYVSVAGVTGARQILPGDILRHVQAVKRASQTPVCVGFGISTAEQVRALSRVADGVIVGSAIIKEIEKQTGKSTLVRQVSRMVQGLTSPLKVREEKE